MSFAENLVGRKEGGRETGASRVSRSDISRTIGLYILLRYNFAKIESSKKFNPEHKDTNIYLPTWYAL